MQAGEPSRDIIGREAELATLAGFVSARSPPRALVITGRPGIGKTTLWEAGIEAARGQGLRVLAARPASPEIQLSFTALGDLLHGVEQEALASLPSPQRHALEVALLRVEPSASAPDARAIAVGFLGALRALAGSGPLLVAIDDLQWLDSQSASALAFAARRSDDAVRFLLARRSDARSELERAFEGARVAHLEPGPLSLGATRRLLSERLNLILPRRVLRRVVESAAGNPLFVLELARSLAERGPAPIEHDVPVPDTVEDLLGTRVDALAAPMRRLLLAVALSADLRASQLAVIAGPGGIDEAVDAGLLVVDAGRVRASHPLIAAAARARSPAAERRELHRELAGAVDDEELRAHHLALAADDPDRELASSVAAAAAGAAARGAAVDAVELAEHALRLTPPRSADRSERLLALARYLLVAGEPQRATDLLAPEIDRLPAGPARARAHLLLADESRFGIADVDEAGDHLEQALAESVGDPALRATIVARRSRYSAVVRVERIPEAEAWALEALPAARAAGPEVEREVLHGLGWARSLRGRPIEDLCERSRVVSKDAFQIFRSLDPLAAERLVSRGELTQARARFGELLELADERGEAWSYARLRLGLCEVELRAGEWETAAQLLDEWAQSSERELLTAPAYGRCRALLALGRGRPDEAEQWAAGAIAASEASGLRWDLLEALRVRGLAALLAGDPGRAVDSLRAVWEHNEREGVEDPGVFPVAPDLVEALVELGELDAAVAVTDRLRLLAEQQEHPWALATARRCRALVQLTSRRWDEAAASELGAAAAAYGHLGLRFDRARSLLVLGRAARRLRKWRVAREALGEAVVAFAEIASDGWMEQARSELARVGARRPGRAGELTPTERRVVELAAEGHSNKEIAQTLFVAVHTVEVHLSHAYAKLGVRSRSQLAGRLSSGVS